MKSLLRSLFVAAAVLALIPAAQAQMECSQCDPQYSWCEESCWYCEVPHPDGYCDQWAVVNTTCGDYMGACLNCNPTWSETGRTAVGTYGESHWSFWDGFSCSHHTVYRVTETDTSQCNESSYYWTRQFCDDDEDGWKWWNGNYVDCCDGYALPGVPDSLFTCNGWHSCF